MGPMRLWILRRFQVYARFALLCSLIVAALAFNRHTLDVVSLTKLTALWVLGIVAAFLWVVLSLARGVWVPRLFSFWLAAAFLAAELVATVFSENRRVSVLGNYGRYGGLLPILLYALIALLIVGLYWERPQYLREVPRVIAYAAFLMSVYVLFQAFGLDLVHWSEAGVPAAFPVGTMGDSNFAGGFLAIAAPFFLYVVLAAQDRRNRILLVLGFLIELAALFATQSRGAFIGLGACLAWLVLLQRERLVRWVRRLALAGFVAAAVVFLVVSVHPGMRQTPRFLSGAGALDLFRTGTLADRGNYWVAGLRIFRHHPIVGTGPESYAANYPTVRSAADGAKLGLTITDKPHNIFVEYAADTGILGLGAYITLLSYVLWCAFRRIRQLQGPSRFLLLAFSGALVAYAGQGFFSIDQPPLAVLGWVAMAGIAVLADPRALAARGALGQDHMPQPDGALPAARNGPTRRLAVGLASLTGVALLVAGVRPYFADRVAYSAAVFEGVYQRTQSGDALKRAASAYERASADNPLEPSYQTFLGSMYQEAAVSATDTDVRGKENVAALAAFGKALAIQPRDIHTLVDVAQLYTAWAGTDPSRYPSAEGSWRKVLSLDPTDYAVHEQFGLMLVGWGQAGNADSNPEAVDQLRQAVQAQPSLEDAWLGLAKAYWALGRPDDALATVLSVKNLFEPRPTEP